MKVFNFEKGYAKLHLIYNPLFSIAVKSICPLRKVIWKISEFYPNSIIDNVSAVLRQEQIFQACKNI